MKVLILAIIDLIFIQGNSILLSIQIQTKEDPAVIYVYDTEN